jgi:hypothetical protein
MQASATANATKLFFMKLLKILTHPWLLVPSFCFILISGEALAQFYAVHLVMSVQEGMMHGILGIAGIIIIIVGHLVFKNRNPKIERITNLIGVGLMIGSLYIFFANDRQSYNANTFSEILPLATVLIFVALAFLFIVSNLGSIFQKKTNSNQYFLRRVTRS